jgi:hypothetical protein
MWIKSLLQKMSTPRKYTFHNSFPIHYNSSLTEDTNNLFPNYYSTSNDDQSTS